MSGLRELKVDDQVKSLNAWQRGRIYIVLGFVTVRSPVLRDDVPHWEQVPGVSLGSLDEPRDYVQLRVDRIHMDDRAGRSGWSLVTKHEVTFIDENGGGPEVWLRTDQDS